MNINELSKEQEKKLFSVILKSKKTKSVLLEVFKNEECIEEFNLIYDKLLK
jgi:phosphoribosyl-AMP cyclohydrolase